MKRKQILTLLMAVTLAAGCITGCGSEESATLGATETEADNSQEIVETEDGKEEQQLMNAVGAVAGTSTAKKQETVFVKTSATGAVSEITVSNWLQNTENSAELKDSSNLNDIKNIKGKQNYTVNGIEVVWDAAGDDIYYQGTTDEKLPVDISISYKLDGKSISPEELAGKSGHVCISMNYTNNTANRVMIGDKEEIIYTPFAVVSGMLLDAEKFRNVSVTNGTVVSDGNNNVVVGMAFPGFVDSLNGGRIGDDDLLSKIEDKITIPSDVTVEADVTDFELGMTLSMISSDAMNALGLDDVDTDLDLDDLTDDLDEFSDAGEELVDGTGKLKDGVQELSDGTVDLVPGTQDLYDGIVDYTDGVVKVDDGVVKLRDGAVDLDNGMTELRDGIHQINTGSYGLKEGAGKLLDGTQQLRAATTTSGASAQIDAALEAGRYIDAQNALAEKLGGSGVTYAILKSANPAAAGQIDYLIKSIAVGTLANIGSSAAQLADGAEQLYNGTVQLSEGTDKLMEGSGKLKNGTCSIKDGTVELYDGTQELRSHNQELIDGAEELKDGAVDLVDGIDKLLDGSIELNDGMIKFDEEGIQKLTDLFDTDYDSMKQRLRAITDAGKSYKSFSGSSDDEDSSVRFVVESAEIKKK